MKVGCIGLGNMGKPLATNLLKAGHQLAIYDINPTRLEELAKMGGIVKGKPSEIPPFAEVIFLSLPSHVTVQEVMLGADGILSTLKQGQIVIDTTTSLPSVSKKMAEKVRAIGADFLDACFGSPPAEVAAQRATFIVGGEASSLEKVRGLLETTAKKIFHVGPTGSGNTVKLVNNLMGLTNTASFIEGLVLGTKAGVKPEVLYEVICSSGGTSIQFERKVPRIINGNFKPFFALDLAYKDLDLATVFAQELKVPVFLGSVARQMFEMARAKGLGSEDNIALIKVLEELSDIQVRK
jgi:3-hydroxyisobutyrate dehydrogenase-like beta-hydroxyacid dehydrogenase